MGQTFSAYASGTNNATNMSNVFVNTESLQSSFSGSSAPGSPVNGQLWLDTSGSEHVLKVYADLAGAGSGWYEVSAVLHAALAGRNQQLTDIRLENLGSHTTPASGVVGEVYLHTGTSKFFGIPSATEREVFLSANNTDYMPVYVPAAAFERDATNPPTAATKGTTPTCRGWLFDAANELASFSVVVPAGYSADADCKLRLWCVLNQAETSGDDIDWTVNLVSIDGTSAEVVSGSSTAATVAQDMSTAVSDGAWHAVDVTLDFDDGTNPIAPGDLLVLEFHRTDLANCGGVIVVGAQVLFPVGSKVTE